MATHFKWYPDNEEVIIPWNARYSFPSQANKAEKMTPRIPPKNGAAFSPGQVIRLEFPAQGYVNPINTTLEFDVVLYGYAPATTQQLRFQNNIQSLFQRVRLLYGATPIEDIINYNVIVRCLTEWTGTNTYNSMDQTSIADGVGGWVMGTDGSNPPKYGPVNVRQKYIQGISTVVPAVPADLTAGTGFGKIPQSAVYPAGCPVPAGDYCVRRYQVNFALGMFTQDKLIPTKFMASQLAIEITLEQPTACIYVCPGSVTGTTPGLPGPTYAVANVNLIPEILQFDASYDAMFLQGLRDGGVPIKFSSWHTFIYSSANSASLQLQVQERSRSVKALFAVQREPIPSYTLDMGACLFDTTNGEGTMNTYQFRVGGRYFPAAPVQCSAALGSKASNGGAEAYVELAKALNIVGDYRLSSATNSLSFGVSAAASRRCVTDYQSTAGARVSTGQIVIADLRESSTNAFCGNMPSSSFACAVSLETSNGLEISGLNAEEQSDIAFLVNWSDPQVDGGDTRPTSIEVYSYYDAMIVLRENNVMELIL